MSQSEREWLEGLRAEDEMEFYLSPDFPSDEDVEVACKAFNGTYRDTETREWLQSSWRHDIEDMRVALQAVADARRTEE